MQPTNGPAKRSTSQHQPLELSCFDLLLHLLLPPRRAPRWTRWAAKANSRARRACTDSGSARAASLSQRVRGHRLWGSWGTGFAFQQHWVALHRLLLHCHPGRHKRHHPFPHHAHCSGALPPVRFAGLPLGLPLRGGAQHEGKWPPFFPPLPSVIRCLLLWSGGLLWCVGLLISILVDWAIDADLAPRLCCRA